MYEIFEQLLKERGLSIAEFSRQTGISKSTLSDWKKGKFQLKDSKRRVIADFFGVTLDYLDGLSESRDGFEQKDRYAEMHKTYDIALRLSDDPELFALFERIESDINYRDRLLQIVELMGDK